MSSITEKCKVDPNGIYLPKEFIEDWYDRLEERHLKYALENPKSLFSQGRFIGGQDVLGDLLEAINEVEN